MSVHQIGRSTRTLTGRCVPVNPNVSGCLLWVGSRLLAGCSRQIATVHQAPTSEHKAGEVRLQEGCVPTPARMKRGSIGNCRLQAEFGTESACGNALQALHCKPLAAPLAPFTPQAPGMVRFPCVRSHMSCRHLFLAFALLGHAAAALSTEESAVRFLQSQAWAGTNTPKQVNVLWGTTGDLNTDGLPDYAAVVNVRQDESTEEEEQLVVLTGTADGGYRLLSRSGTFCGAGRSGKFYNLRMDAKSLFVQAVWTAEGERYSGRTLQLRYHHGIDDLELIGEEEVSRDNGQDYKISVNFLTGAVTYSRAGKKQRKEVHAQLIPAPLFRLQSFVCFSQDDLRPRIHIDESFRIKRN